MRKKKILLSGIILGMMTCGLLMVRGNKADAATVTSTVPKIVGNEKVIYLDSNDKIAIQGKRIVSVNYASTKKKVAAINKTGKINPKRKGKTTIKATVVYRKKAGGKKYTKNLSYKLQVYGKVQEYFECEERTKTYEIIGLTKKGKKLSSIYIPENVKKKKVTHIGNLTFNGNKKLKELYLSDNLKNVRGAALSGCSNLKKVFLGKSFIRKIYQGRLFKNCTSLKKVELDERNKNFKMKAGVLLSSDTIWYYPAKKKANTYKLPNSINNIATGAFQYCMKLKEIKMSENVTYFGDYCFMGSGITSIEFSDKVTKLGKGMFKDCESLKKVTLSNGIESIPAATFFNCDSLKSFTISAGVKYIGESAFGCCAQLMEYKTSSENTNYQATDGILYDKKGTVLVSYPSGKDERSYTVKDGITTIGSGAFYGCEAIQKVVLPDTVKEIFWKAFAKSGLTEISLPDSVGSIGKEVFKNCYNLKKINLSNKIQKLEDGVFENCKKLEQITLSQNLQSLNTKCFKGCDKLERIFVDDNNTIFTTVDGILYSKNKEYLYYYPNAKKGDSYTVPNTVKTISDWAFCSTKYLKKITVSNETKDIQDYAFSGCTSVEEINMPKEIDVTIEDEFIGVIYIELDFSNCSSLKKITLPEGCKGINYMAFEGCTALKEIVLPESITHITASMFGGCENVEKITLGSKVTKIGKDAFYDCKNLKELVIKSKRIKASNVDERAFYKAGANNYKKLVVKVPSSKKNVYKKMFRASGLSKKAKVTA